MQVFVLINNVGIKIKDKYKDKCKELIDKGVYDKGFIWNPSNCEYECYESCGVGTYLGYENCKCRKKLVEECTKNVDKTGWNNFSWVWK